MARLYVYGVLSRLYFHLPILLVFFVLHDVGIVASEAMLAVYGVALTAGSALSSRLPRRISESQLLGIGEIVKAVGVLLLAAAGTGDAALLFAGQIIAGLGFGFTVGRESAVLRHIVEPDQVPKAQGRLQSYLLLANFVAGVIGAIMFQTVPWLPFVAVAVTSLIAAAVVWGMDGGTRAVPSQERTRIRLGRRRTAWMLYYIVTRGIGFALYLAVLPLLLGELGLSLWAFGLVLGVFTVAAYFSARYTTGLIARMGEWRLTIITILSLFAALCLFAFVHTLPSTFLGIFLLGIGLGCVRPLGLLGLDLPALAPAARSWVLLTQERYYGIVNAALIIAVGVVFAVSVNDFTLVLAGFGAIYLAFAVVFTVLLGAGVWRPAVSTPTPEVSDRV